MYLVRWGRSFLHKKWQKNGFSKSVLQFIYQGMNLKKEV